MKTVSLELISGIKRKQVKDIVAALLTMLGDEEQAEFINNSGRVTTGMIDRVFAPYLDTDTEAEPKSEEPAEEPEDAPTVKTTEEPKSEDGVDVEAVQKKAKEDAQEAIDQLKDLDTLIAKGKKKKAKKLLKAILETGVKGAEISVRKQQVKEL